MQLQEYIMDYFIKWYSMLNAPIKCYAEKHSKLEGIPYAASWSNCEVIFNCCMYNIPECICVHFNLRWITESFSIHSHLSVFCELMSCKCSSR